ncbi:exosome complex component RRP43-like [Venturia canescens]|uniref:exosome complex component RRP43-like n=1 Tax=Venturia canescens TaxID=32260 RepID=UPI001C9CA479|nr:exosome complex component RRP43-like [Venturia canescens]
MASLYKSIYPVKYLRDYLTQNIRPDGRDFLTFRPISINVSSITHADSSAIFKIGNTTVVCGIKAELSVPKAATPDKGYVVPNVSLSPICSPKFRPGPPSDQAQETSQLVYSILRDSDILDLSSLCICKDKLVWVLYCDMECIDCDGSVIDACIGALIASLATLTLPEVAYNPETGSTIVHTSKRHSVPIKSLVTSTTFAVFDNELLIADPTEEEETQSLTHFTIAMDKDVLCCVHKPGGVAISTDLFVKSLTRAKKRAERVRELIDTAITSK